MSDRQTTATGHASAPPKAPTTRLSVKSWRLTRARDAPIARRTETSCARAVTRASRRLVRLAQTISSMTPKIALNTPSCRVVVLLEIRDAVARRDDTKAGTRVPFSR